MSYENLTMVLTMENNNLISLNQRPIEEALEIQRKGGQVSSERKRLANLTKNLRHGKYANKFSLLVKELAENPKYSALKIFELITRLEKNWNNLPDKLKIDLVHLYCKAHLTIHHKKDVEEHWSLARLMSVINGAYIQKNGHPPIFTQNNLRFPIE